jgi:hypothetical protein
VSQQEVVAAYLDGRMSRRTLIRRLVAGGVSVSAAVAYAHVLQPGRATARAFGDLHGPAFTLQIPDQDLDRVVRQGKVKIKVTAEGARSIPIYVRLYRPRRETYASAVIAAATYEAPTGKSTVKIPIAYNVEGDVNHSMDAIRKRKRAKLGVLDTDANVGPAHQRTIAR